MAATTTPVPSVETVSPIRGAGEASRYLAGSKAPWQPAGADGYWVKPLYEDAGKGERTVLMKADPGTVSPPHAHEEFEEVYILEGSFHDDDHLLVAGDYVCREPGAIHSGGSAEGAVMLVIYRAR